MVFQEKEDYQVNLENLVNRELQVNLEYPV
jgi:hypothetical protein